MASVPREQFVPESLRGEAYADRALGIDCGQTISQPYIVALMTQALQLSGSEKVLEIGTGSGYQTAILAETAREVVSIERLEGLSRKAAEILKRLGYQNITPLVGDGSQGDPARAPFDRIVVTAAAAFYPPALFEQLAEGGTLVMPLGGPEHQTLQAIRKSGGVSQAWPLCECRFVPLVSARRATGIIGRGRVRRAFLLSGFRDPCWRFCQAQAARCCVGRGKAAFFECKGHRIWAKVREKRQLERDFSTFSRDLADFLVHKLPPADKISHTCRCDDWCSPNHY